MSGDDDDHHHRRRRRRSCRHHRHHGPVGQSSSAGAAIKGFNRVEETVSRFESSLSGWILLIERMQRVVFLFAFLKLGRDCPSDVCVSE